MSELENTVLSSPLYTQPDEIFADKQLAHISNDHILVVLATDVFEQEMLNNLPTTRSVLAIAVELETALMVEHAAKEDKAASDIKIIHGYLKDVYGLTIANHVIQSTYQDVSAIAETLANDEELFVFE